MDGKIFYSMSPPPPPAAGFAFDLQRFTEYTLTQETTDGTTTYKLTGTENGSTEKTANTLSALFSSSNISSSDTVTVNSQITVNETDTIDFQGVTITGNISGGAVFNVTGGTVSMTNGTINASRSGGSGEISAVSVQSNATLNLGNDTADESKKITISGTGTGGTATAIGVTLNGGKLNVNNDATVTSNNDCAIWYDADNSECVVNGGTVSVTDNSNDNTAIGMSKSKTGGKLTIKSGTVSAVAAAAISTQNSAELTIEGGTISNTSAAKSCAIAFRGSGTKLNMSGGTVHSENSNGYCTISMSGFSNYNASNYTLNITGGTISSKSVREGYSCAALQIGVDNGTSTGNSITVKDCTITSDSGTAILLYDDCTLENVVVNGKTYGIYTAAQSPTVTIKNSTITADTYTVIHSGTGSAKFTIESGTFTGNASYSPLQGSGTFTVNGGLFNRTDSTHNVTTKVLKADDENTVTTYYTADSVTSLDGYSSTTVDNKKVFYTSGSTVAQIRLPKRQLPQSVREKTFNTSLRSKRLSMLLRQVQKRRQKSKFLMMLRSALTLTSTTKT